MERLQCVGLFTRTEELDRPTGYVTHRQCGTAAGITIGFGEDYAGQRQRLAEGLGGGSRILAGHRVDHEQRFNRRDRGVQCLDLGHHRLIDLQAAGGSDNQYIDHFPARGLQRSLRDFDRVLAGLRREEFHSDLFGQRTQLLDRGRTIDVAADHHHLFLLALGQQPRQFGNRGGLAGALQARHQHYGRGVAALSWCWRHPLRWSAVADDLTSARPGERLFLPDRRRDLHALISAFTTGRPHRPRVARCEPRARPRGFSSVSRPRPRRRLTVSEALAERFEHGASR